jgi:site-specific DNA-methyltransferase (adenine-specific)
MVAFSGTRTYHRMAVAIEDAGFEIREMLSYIFGSGFPKSHSMRDIGRPELGTALKPAHEPICLARKPLSESSVAGNVLRWGTGALNIDGCRIEGAESTARPSGVNQDVYGADDRRGMIRGGSLLDRWPANLCHDGSPEVLAGFPETTSGAMKREVGAYEGENVTGFLRGNSGPSNQHGDSGSAARFFASFPQEETAKQGRWPANLVHDGSEEVLAGFPESASGIHSRRAENANSSSYGFPAEQTARFGGDSGSAARFFYTAKADADDRLGSKHPTVKPVDLMQWLVRLVCPKGATVLDPFAGTGTTGAASFIEGRRCVLIEREAEYLADIEKRMGMLLMGSEERSWKLAKPEPLEALPLFALTGD